MTTCIANENENSWSKFRRVREYIGYEVSKIKSILPPRYVISNHPTVKYGEGTGHDIEKSCHYKMMKFVIQTSKNKMRNTKTGIKKRMYQPPESSLDNFYAICME